MIKEIILDSPKKYGRYFLSSESSEEESVDFKTTVIDIKPMIKDDEILYEEGEEENTEEETTTDETEETNTEETPAEDNTDQQEETPEQPEIKFNTKVIEIKPNNRSKIDFTDGADVDDEIPDDTNPETMDDTTDTNVEIQDDNTGGIENNDELVNQVSSDNEEINNDQDPDFTAGAEDEGETPTDDGETNDDTDFTDGATDGEENTTDTTTDNQDTSNTDDQKKGPGLEYDSTRKYVLFENYLSLCNAINNYISKFENMMADDYTLNQVLKTVTTKLREIKDLCYDYMTMKFEISSYIQSLLFFQNLIVMVQMAFDIYAKYKNNKIQKLK